MFTCTYLWLVLGLSFSTAIFRSLPITHAPVLSNLKWKHPVSAPAGILTVSEALEPAYLELESADSSAGH